MTKIEGRYRICPTVYRSLQHELVVRIGELRSPVHMDRDRFDQGGQIVEGIVDVGHGQSCRGKVFRALQRVLPFEKQRRRGEQDHTLLSDEMEKRIGSSTPTARSGDQNRRVQNDP